MRLDRRLAATLGDRAITLVVLWAIMMLFVLPSASHNAVTTFTLTKVVGRDIWIGVWAFVLSIVAKTRWDKRRFPKFVLGFLSRHSRSPELRCVRAPFCGSSGQRLRRNRCPV